MFEENGEADEPERDGASGGFESRTPQAEAETGAIEARQSEAGEVGDLAMHAPLFSADESAAYYTRWDVVQVGFVDEPRHAVEQADELVASAMRRLADIFAKERQKLEAQWDSGDNVSTEDLRQALRRYRSFFSRVLSV